jgi:hypothetical protein
MNKRSVLFAWALAAGLLTAWPAAAYIKAPPQTLGSVCLESDHVCVLKVDKVDAEKGVIHFKHVEQLKGKHDGGTVKHLITPDLGEGIDRTKGNAAKIILDWAAEGKMAVMFYFTGGNSRGHVYIDGYWYWIVGVRDNPANWVAAGGEPTQLTTYCGAADKLRDAVEKILKGEEVVVPVMSGENRADLLQRRAKVQDARASLKIVGADTLARIANRSDGKKPAVTEPDATDAKPGEKKPDGTKPVDKPVEKPVALVGTVKAIAADGKSFALLLPPTEKNKEPTPIEIQITEQTKITDGKGIAKLAVGQVVSVSLQKGDAKVASVVQLGKPGEKPTTKPAPGEKPGKPGADDKPEAPRKPRDPNKPVRDQAPTATVIDAEIDKQLAVLKIPAAPQADAAEFLRRVTLDLTGRVPTYQQTVTFLDSKDPDKRRKLIDGLLDSEACGDHFATVWQNVLVGRGIPGDKTRGNTFRPWLAEQFNNERGWDAIVTDLLTAEGTPNTNPATAFLIANGEQGQPQPNKIAGSAASAFWGVNLRCAECHDHPFIHWKQSDFWGAAAFFGKLQYGGAKGGPQTLTEVAPGSPGSGTKVKGQPSIAVSGTAILVPAGPGKAAGKAVKARYLGGAEAVLDEKEPFRPAFAKWATAADNPYFAKAMVNRMWAHFFGRGLVNPLDGFDETNPASHPELLDKLAKEFAASGFDLKHLGRCITTSKAYQRTSRRAEGAKVDLAAYSHMSVKALTPEAFYDSVAVVTRGNTGKLDTRDQFVRDFRYDDEVPVTEYIQGIPQMLALMNGPLLNRDAPVIDRLVSSGASHTDGVTTLYLTVLSRRPSADELTLMTRYLSNRKDDREGYRGVLWILLNTSEFALNR